MIFSFLQVNSFSDSIRQSNANPVRIIPKQHPKVDEFDVKGEKNVSFPFASRATSLKKSDSETR